jgi:ribosomal-protein-alanine N-acetyltransferase
MEAESAFDYRPLQPGDLSLLQQALPPLLGGRWSLRALQLLLQDCANNPVHHCRVLSPAAGAACGFAEFLTVLDECQLLNFAIVAARQRLGLGRMLLDLVLQEAAERGCGYCVLELRASNQPALALYRAGGFRDCGLRKAYYPPLASVGEREDALLLRRDLG